MILFSILISRNKILHKQTKKSADQKSTDLYYKILKSQLHLNLYLILITLFPNPLSSSKF